jgi:small-conductance mechanosensitive channel
MPLQLLARVAAAGGEAVAAEAAEAAPKNIRQVAERMSQWGPRLMNTAFQHIEEFMIAFSIALAGVIVGYVVYRLMTACLGTHGRALVEEVGPYRQTRNAKTGDLEWQAPKTTDPLTGKSEYETSKILSRWSGTTTWHLFALFLRTLIIIISLYIAFDTIGVDVGSLVASLGIVAAIVTFAARDLIVNTAAAFCIMSSGLVQEGMYMMIGGVKGHVFRIHSMTTVLVEQDGTTGKLIIHNVPNSFFYAMMSSRVIDLEKGIVEHKEEFKKLVIDHVEAVAPAGASSGLHARLPSRMLKEVKTV